MFADRLRAKDFTVEDVAHRLALPLVEQEHYAKGMSHTSVFTHGLFDDLGALLGVATWLPPTKPAAISVDPEGWQKVLALSRLVIAPGVPKNACSFVMARSIALIRRDGRFRSLVSYADSAQGHTGAIYRLSGWTYMGKTKPTAYWVDPKTGRMVAALSTKTRTVQEMREREVMRCAGVTLSTSS